MKIAAIDIGSNAVRLVVGEADDKGYIGFTDKVRTPIRLGADVFKNQRVSPQTAETLTKELKNYYERISDEGISIFRAVATSAFREANNGHELAEDILDKTGLKIDIIDYQEEADIIYKAVEAHTAIDIGRNILMDIGGGSVELTHFADGKLETKTTFPLGTVRTLIQCESENDVKDQIQNYRSAFREFIYDDNKSISSCIGTGGNLDCMYAMKRDYLGGSQKERVKLHQINKLIDTLIPMTIEERIQTFELRPDRADVIIPALYITQMLMEVCGANRIYTPGVGLKEGLIYDLYDKS